MDATIFPKFTACAAFYDPILDVEEVDQFGYLDLRQSFLTGTVEGSLAPEDTSYNGVEDASSLLPPAKDVFEATRQAEAVTKSRSAAAAAAKSEDAAASSAAAE